MSLITRVSLTAFSFEAENLAASAKGSSIGGLFYEKGARTEITKYAIRLETEDGCIGEYVLNWGASPSVFGQMQMLAPMLVGRHAEERQGIYDDLKREARQFDHMGHGPLDIALWDWQGRALNCSVSTLLGGYRKKLPAYASTYHGDRNGGLDSKEAFADFALACADMGYKAFKIHGWHEGNIREEAELVLYVRKMVGDDMTLMLDPACQLRSFADALYVGRACDDANFFWLEDPYRDSGVSAFGHQKLRSMIKTPLLQTEHIRGVEPKADFLIAGGTDFLRSDPEYDMGLTGGQKIHHLAEGFGVDVEVHACGPAHRHLMAASRNSNFYEVALVGPDCPNAVAPVY
ncbi:MAG: enolase C-terminal domain-like protein, partial [Pseudomonadota bacterium]|nr:enolase C-terminal domain-like protein [Pseudomonadota bacterium]MEC7246314.1 enolase C-terminal domain-like protein [Pseudomonadota bacterium]